MTHRRPDLPSKSVLVVDDDALMRKLISAVLSKSGYQVSIAHDGAEALEVVRHRRFDCIVMDVDMPRMTGLEAARAIRDLPGPAGRVPIVAVTGRTDPEDVADCHHAGMDWHCGKPVAPSDLVRAIALSSGPGRRRFVHAPRREGLFEALQ